MEEFRLIELHRMRDFGKKINATFEFVKQNFKPLGKSVLLIAGPPLTIGSLMIGSFMGDFMSTIFSQAGTGNPEALNKFFLSWNFWAQFILMFVFLIVSAIMSISTINNFVLLYNQKKSNDISVQEVWDKVRGSLGIYLGSAFLFFLMFIAAYILVIIITIGFGAASPVLGFLGAAIGGCAMAYVWVGSSLTLFIQTFESKNFFAALGRSLKLTQGKWWSTFGLVFVLGLIAYAVSYFFLIPYYIIMGTSMAHKVSSPLAQM